MNHEKFMKRMNQQILNHLYCRLVRIARLSNLAVNKWYASIHANAQAIDAWMNALTNIFGIELQDATVSISELVPLSHPTRPSASQIIPHSYFARLLHSIHLILPNYVTKGFLGMF